jgi:hypothetical protein
MKIIFDVLMIVSGFVSYQRGRAKRIARRPIYDGLLAQFNAAAQAMELVPSTDNRLAKDRCELNLLYESQRGRPLRRVGVVLFVLGAALLYWYR